MISHLVAPRRSGARALEEVGESGVRVRHFVVTHHPESDLAVDTLIANALDIFR